MGLIIPAQVDRVDNLSGWSLEVRAYRDEAKLVPGRRPILMIPGYAMNSFILGYHPAGTSMVGYLVDQGFEVWTANLRGQGGSLPYRRPARFGMAELALDDLPAAMNHVLRHTRTGADRLDPIGCSLGASFLYTYLAHHPHDHRVGAAVAIGGPLRWETMHPLFRVAFSSGRLAGAIPIKGTRRLAKAALPLLTRVKPLLSIYMNADEIDLSNAEQLVHTVDDPIPYVNRQLARWVRDRDLILRGVNVTEGLKQVQDVPLLVLLANRDGIVTPEAARSVVASMGAERVDVQEIGTPERWYAHADLFIGNHAEAEVFAPLATWLADHAP